MRHRVAPTCIHSRTGHADLNSALRVPPLAECPLQITTPFRLISVISSPPASLRRAGMSRPRHDPLDNPPTKRSKPSPETAAQAASVAPFSPSSFSASASFSSSLSSSSSSPQQVSLAVSSYWKELTCDELKQIIRSVEATQRTTSKMKKEQLLRLLGDLVSSNPQHADKVGSLASQMLALKKGKRSVAARWDSQVAQAKALELKSIADTTYKAPPNSQSLLTKLLDDLPKRQAHMARGIVCGVIGSQGSGKSYMMNEIMLYGWQPAVMDDQEPFVAGNDGPLLAANPSHSVTKLLTRIQYDTTAMRKCFTVTHSMRREVQTPGGSQTDAAQTFEFNRQGFREAREHIAALVSARPASSAAAEGESERSAAGEQPWEVILHGPWPGLASLQLQVFSSIPTTGEAERSIELRDLPGYGDSIGHPRLPHYIQDVDVLLFRHEGHSGRGAQAADLLRLVEVGALRTFATRITLVNVINAYTAGKGVHKWKQLISTYQQELDEAFDIILESQSANDTADSGEEKGVATPHERFLQLVAEKKMICVDSMEEGQSLLRRARAEAHVLVFFNRQQEGDLHQDHSVITQLAELLRNEATSKLKQKRLHPMLDFLIRVAKQLKNRVGQKLSPSNKHMLRNQDPVRQFRESLTDPSSLLVIHSTLTFNALPVTTVTGGRKAEQEDDVRGLAPILLTTSAVGRMADLVKMQFQQEVEKMCTQCDRLLHLQLQAARRDSVGKQNGTTVSGDEEADGLSEIGFLRSVPQQMLLDEVDKLFDDPASLVAKELQASLPRAVKSVCMRSGALRVRLQALQKAAVVDNLSDSDSGDEGPERVGAARPAAALGWEEAAVRLILEEACQFKRRSPSQLRQAFDHLRTQCVKAYVSALEEHVQVNVDQEPDARPPAALPQKAAALLSRTQAKEYHRQLLLIINELRDAIREFDPTYSVGEQAQRLLASDALPVFEEFNPQPRPADLRTNILKCLMEPRLSVGQRLGLLHDPEYHKGCQQAAIDEGLLNGVKDSAWRSALLAAACRLHDVQLGELKMPAFNPNLLPHAMKALYHLQPSRARITIAPEEDDTKMEMDRKTNGEAEVMRSEWIIQVKCDCTERQLTAHLSLKLLEELRGCKHSAGEVLRGAADFAVAPIFIPSIHCGGSGQPLGNLWLDGYFQKAEVDQEQKVSFGLENGSLDDATDLDWTFVLVEPGQLSTFIQSFGVNTVGATRHPNTRLVWVVLPVNMAGFGYAITIGKLLAEALRLPCYWTFDDDIFLCEQYQARSWRRASVRRALLAGQAVLRQQLSNLYKPLAHSVIKSILNKVFDKKTQAGLLNQMMMLNAISEIKELDEGRLPTASLLCTQPELLLEHPTCSDVPMALKEMVVIELRAVSLQEAGLIAGVSISHVPGRRQDYVSKSEKGTHRVSTQRYQVVLHHTCAEMGLALVHDDVLFLQKPWHTISRDNISDELKEEWRKWRRGPGTGGKGADKAFTHALKALGRYGFIIFSFAHHAHNFGDSRGYGHASEMESQANSEASEADS